MGMVIFFGVIYCLTCILCGSTFAVNDKKFWKFWSVGNVIISFANLMFAIDKL